MTSESLFFLFFFLPEKNSGLNGFRTHDLCDAGAVLYHGLLFYNDLRSTLKDLFGQVME